MFGLTTGHRVVLWWVTDVTQIVCLAAPRGRRSPITARDVIAVVNPTAVVAWTPVATADSLRLLAADPVLREKLDLTAPPAAR